MATSSSLIEFTRQVSTIVGAFIEREVVPFEAEALCGEDSEGTMPILAALDRLQAKTRHVSVRHRDLKEGRCEMDLDVLLSAIAAVNADRCFIPFAVAATADSILRAGTREQQRRYLIPMLEGRLRPCFALTEVDARPHAENLRTRAERYDDHWLINGEKIFVVGGGRADYAMVFAATEPDPDSGTDVGVTCFLVDRTMGWTSKSVRAAGQWSPTTLIFGDVHVPADNVLGAVGAGSHLASRWAGQEPRTIPVRAIEAAERIQRIMIGYARARRSLGESITDYQALFRAVADTQAEIEVAKWLALHPIRQVQHGPGGEHT